MIVLRRSEVARYCRAVHYRGAGWPQSYLLTLWRYFSVPELMGREYWLSEQAITIKRPLVLDHAYAARLVRCGREAHQHGELWRYQLILLAKQQEVATCLTTIWVASVLTPAI
ncbi:MAG: hypothetical protein LKJ48_00395 [Lactobacillus sp.]|jgi:hypothetical protein|nr:hypothetical protein [Lactobacillus sp.]